MDALTNPYVLVVGNNEGSSVLYSDVLGAQNIPFQEIDPLPYHILDTIKNKRDQISSILLSSCNIPRDHVTEENVQKINIEAEKMKPGSTIVLESHGIALAKEVRSQYPSLPLIVNYIGHDTDLVSALLNSNEDDNLYIFGIDDRIFDVLSPILSKKSN